MTKVMHAEVMKTCVLNSRDNRGVQTNTTGMEKIPSSKLIVPQLVNKYTALYDGHKISLLNSILGQMN